MVPNINFGSPTIFFDSNPEQQESYAYSYWSSFKSTLKIAWTGDVPKELYPGTLRLVWWTSNGSRCIKDFQLHQHALAKESYDSLLNIPDVKRCLITGFSGQNPYTMKYSHSSLADTERKVAREKRQQEYWANKEAARGAPPPADGRVREDGEVDIGTLMAFIEKEEAEEEAKRVEKERREWEEEEERERKNKGGRKGLLKYGEGDRKGLLHPDDEDYV